MGLFCSSRTNVFIVIFSLVGASISYEAIEVAKLPKALTLQSTYYDSSSDTAYLFGGVTQDFPGSDFITNYEIYSFTLSNNSVSKVGNIPKGLGSFTKTHVLPSSKSDSSHLLLYFLVPQSIAEFTLVHLFNATDGSLKQTGFFRISLELSEFAQSSSGELFVFGGPPLKNNIARVNLEYEPVQWNVVGTMQQDFTGMEVVPIATVYNTAYLFGGNFDEALNQFPHITVNLETLESSDPLTILPDSPRTFQQRSISSTRDEIFVLGGFGTNDILRMNATSQAYKFEPILNTPLRDNATWYIAPSQVWVEKLKRIYFIGGTQVDGLGTTENVNSIWYIDLK